MTGAWTRTQNCSAEAAAPQFHPLPERALQKEEWAKDVMDGRFPIWKSLTGRKHPGRSAEVLICIPKTRVVQMYFAFRCFSPLRADCQIRTECEVASLNFGSTYKVKYKTEGSASRPGSLSLVSIRGWHMNLSHYLTCLHAWTICCTWVSSVLSCLGLSSAVMWGSLEGRTQAIAYYTVGVTAHQKQFFTSLK